MLVKTCSHLSEDEWWRQATTHAQCKSAWSSDHLLRPHQSYYLWETWATATTEPPPRLQLYRVSVWFPNIWSQVSYIKDILTREFVDKIGFHSRPWTHCPMGLLPQSTVAWTSPNLSKLLHNRAFFSRLTQLSLEMASAASSQVLHTGEHTELWTLSQELCAVHTLIPNSEVDINKKCLIWYIFIQRADWLSIICSFVIRSSHGCGVLVPFKLDCLSTSLL